MEEGRSSVGGDGTFHDVNPAVHTPEQVPNSVEEVVIISLYDFDDPTALDLQEV